MLFRSRCGLRTLPRVLHVADGLGSRVLVGTRSLLVLDAQQLAGMAPAARTHLLLHELMHVRRGDPWRGLVLGTLCAAFWFHPLVWLLARRLHQLRKLCCDQAVVQRLGGDPQDYRSTLLTAARTLVATPAHGFAPWGSLVLQRLHALERPRRTAAALRHATIAVATALLAVACVPLAPPAPGFDLEAALRAPGCLNRQFAAFAALAQADAASPSSATEASR